MPTLGEEITSVVMFLKQPKTIHRSAFFLSILLIFLEIWDRPKIIGDYSYSGKYWMVSFAFDFTAVCFYLSAFIGNWIGSAKFYYPCLSLLGVRFIVFCFQAIYMLFTSIGLMFTEQEVVIGEEIVKFYLGLMPYLSVVAFFTKLFLWHSTVLYFVGKSAKIHYDEAKKTELKEN